MPRPPLEGTVLVTGASAGLGRELARQLGGRARALILVARRADRLAALAEELRAARPGLEVRTESCDLASADERERLLAALAGTEVDVLVNNAGLGDLELFERAGWEKLAGLLEVNVLALTHLTHRLLPPMLARGRGGVLNVSSGLGLTFMPAMAVYGGSKHYVTAFSEALRLELRGTGVVVSQLCPGPVATEFLEVAGNPFGKPLPPALELSAERCARVALRGFARGKALIVPGALMRFVIALGRLTPRAILRLVYRGLGRYLRKRPVAALPAGVSAAPSSAPPSSDTSQG